MRGSFLDIAQRHPGIQTAVMNACHSVWGVTALVIPARRVILRTIRPAPCRSSRRPSAGQEYGPVRSFAGDQVDRPGRARRQRG